MIASKRLAEMDWEHWRRVLDINLLGTFFVVQEAVTRMLAAGGEKSSASHPMPGCAAAAG